MSSITANYVPLSPPIASTSASYCTCSRAKVAWGIICDVEVYRYKVSEGAGAPRIGVDAKEMIGRKLSKNGFSTTPR
jgi:hypothetical protein